MPAFTNDAGAGLQAQFDADPQFQSLLHQFQATKAPTAWLALTQYANTKANAGGNTTRFALQIDGDGRVQMQDRNNPWSSPATWGPIAVGGASLGLGLLASGGGGGAAVAPEIATTSTGAATGVAAPTAAGLSGGLGGTTAATGGGMGWADAIKTGLDWYNKGSGALSDIGQIAGNDAAAAAQGRGMQAQIQQGQDRNAIALYQAQLAAAKQAMEQNSTLASQAGQGDLMANVQDVQLNNLPASVQGHMPTMTGGLRPSVLGPNARQAGQTLSRNALLQLMQGSSNLPMAPKMTPMPDASGYDDFSKILARAGSYAGAANPLFDLFANQKKAPYQTVGPPMPPGNFDPEMG